MHTYINLYTHIHTYTHAYITKIIRILVCFVDVLLRPKPIELTKRLSSRSRYQYSPISCTLPKREMQMCWNAGAKPSAFRWSWSRCYKPARSSTLELWPPWPSNTMIYSKWLRYWIEWGRRVALSSVYDLRRWIFTIFTIYHCRMWRISFVLPAISDAPLIAPPFLHLKGAIQCNPWHRPLFLRNVDVTCRCK